MWDRFIGICTTFLGICMALGLTFKVYELVSPMFSTKSAVTSSPVSYSKIATNFPRSSSEVDDGAVAEVAEAVRKINSKTPFMIDDDVLMHRMTAGPGAQATFHYSLPHHALTVSDKSWFLAEMKTALLKLNCPKASTRAGHKRGMSAQYIYYTNEGVEIGRFKIGKKDCAH